MPIIARVRAFFRSDAKLGLKILAGGGLFSLASVMPLLVYAVLGPSDGNPIGLGLLAMLGIAVLQLSLVVGVVVLAVEHLRGPRRTSRSPS